MNRWLLVLCVCLLFVFAGTLPAADNVPALDTPAVSAQDMLKPDMFPNAQFGMSMESISDGSVAKVVTTGGEFIINKGKDTIECRQRISKGRTVATVKLRPGTLKDSKLTFKASGSAIFSGPSVVLRINGDSLLMIQPKKDGDIKVELAFTPDYHKEFYGNYNFFDPDGGICFYENGKCPDSKMQAAVDPVTVTWPWKGGDIFWAGVSPPKPYDWDAALKSKVVRWGSDHTLPSDMDILRWTGNGYGKIIFLQSVLFKHWQLDLSLRNPAELQRVVKTAHENGAKVMVYASPMMFLKGTSAEPLARGENDPGGTGWRTGSNAFLYMKGVTPVVKEYGVDGLYFDGMYLSRLALATGYYLSRATRELVGDSGLLEFHATEDALGDVKDGAYCPTIHAYMNFVLKGEFSNPSELFTSPGYFRYYLSTYNTSNSIAVECWFNYPPEKGRIEQLIANNVHLHFPEHWLFTNEDEVLRKYYWPKLAPALKDEIMPKLMKPTGEFERYRKSLSSK